MSSEQLTRTQSGRRQLEASMSNLCACFRMSTKHSCLAISLAISALFFILLALFGPTAVQTLLNEGIETAIIWSPDSLEMSDLRYRGLCDPSDPRAIYSNVRFYLYNITNVDEMRQGAKPVVALVGPYTYIKVTCKLDVWWDSEGHVSAKEYVHYEYPLTGRNPGDADLQANITTLNLALGSVVETIHANVGPNSAVWLDLLVTVLAGWQDSRIDGMFVHRTAEELLWGYEDPLLSRLASILPAGIIPRTRVAFVTNVTGPDVIRSGQSNMYDTGAHNISNVWTVIADHNLTQLTCWPGGDACVEEVQGTDGNQFRPGLKLHDRLTLWMGALFRSAELVTLGPQMFNGIRLLRFQPDVGFYAIDPCKQQHIRGLLNITAPMAVGPAGNGSAAYGAPILVSPPHYCGADSSLRKGVVGLPGCQGVDTQLVYIDVEPMTGISMRAKQNIMVSSQITQAMRQHLEPRLDASPVIPMYWSTETAEAPEDQARQFRRVVYGAKRLKAMLHLWPMLLATACASACACVLVHASLTHLRQVLRIEEEDEEANRRARQAIIDRVRSATSASPADVTVVGGTAGLGLEAGASSGGATSSSEPGLAPAEPTGGATNTESSLKQPLLPQ